MKTLKKTIFLAILMLFLSNFTNAQETKDSGVTIEFENAAESIKLLQSYIMAVNDGDLDKMQGLLSEKAMIYGLNGGNDSLTVSKHKEFYTTSFATYDHTVSGDVYLPLKVTADVPTKGEWIFGWGSNTIKNKKSGIETSFPYHIVGIVADGKIVMLAYYYDRLNILKNQGYTITPPKG